MGEPITLYSTSGEPLTVYGKAQSQVMAALGYTDTPPTPEIAPEPEQPEPEPVKVEPRKARRKGNL